MTRLTLLSGAALLSALLVVHGAVAETTTEETTTTTTSSTGTVTELAPGAIVVRSESAPSPVTYTTKTTTYVDEAGNPVSVETVRSGAPVTVYYTQGPDGLAASKVVVRRMEPASPTGDTVIHKTTTTRTTKDDDDD